MSEQPECQTAEFFEPLKDSEFLVRVDDAKSVQVKLVEVTRLPPATDRTDLNIRQDPFGLIFQAVDDGELQQRVYRLEHATGGSIEMFLVPVGFGQYQAIFN